jgi:hypothetical protein
MNDRLGQPPEAMQRREDIAGIVAVSCRSCCGSSCFGPLHARGMNCWEEVLMEPMPFFITVQSVFIRLDDQLGEKCFG